jgi:hypothetical protein
MYLYLFTLVLFVSWIILEKLLYVASVGSYNETKRSLTKKCIYFQCRMIYVALLTGEGGSSKRYSHYQIKQYKGYSVQLH